LTVPSGFIVDPQISNEEEATLWSILLGMVLIISGVLYLLRTALGQRRLSDPHGSSTAESEPTLEPQRQGLAFLAPTRNWPALCLIAAGALLLLFGTSVGF
jgi:hypothetical protein